MDLKAARDRALADPAVRAILHDDPPEWGLSEWGWEAPGAAWVYAGPPAWLEGREDFLDPLLIRVDRAGVAITTYLAEATRLEGARLVGQPPEFQPAVTVQRNGS
jgi:hypothetical protein